jgi:hypothetical protein
MQQLLILTFAASSGRHAEESLTSGWPSACRGLDVDPAPRTFGGGHSDMWHSVVSFSYVPTYVHINISYPGMKLFTRV